MTIPCKARAEHRPSWVVLGREVCKIAGSPDIWHTPGTSTLLCTVCNVAWRSSSRYVDQLPDHERVLTVADIYSAGEAKARAVAELIEQHPLLAELTYSRYRTSLAGHSTFLVDVAEKFAERGTLTKRQIETVERIIRERIQKANELQLAREVLRAAERALGHEPAPEGDATVEGVVEQSWLPEPSGFETVPRWRMRVRADGGYVIECAVPAPIRRVAVGDDLLGRRVRVSAWWKRRSLMESWGVRPKRDSQVL
jgi:hypothetical protein